MTSFVSKDAALPRISPFAEFRHKPTLGDTLDALFAQWSERGPPVSLISNLPLTDVTLEIERYSRGWDVEFFIRRRTKEKWTIRGDSHGRIQIFSRIACSFWTRSDWHGPPSG